MNARLLTLLLLSCSLAIGKTVMAPKLQALSTAKAQAASLDRTIAATQQEQRFVSTFEPSPAEPISIDRVTMDMMSRLHHSYPDFGLSIGEVSAGNSVGGQSVLPMTALQGQVSATGFMSQEISIKGTYESLEEFQGFLNQQILAHGGSLSTLKLRNNSFELKVQVFGQAHDAPKKAGV
jgi:hypothetical protein